MRTRNVREHNSWESMKKRCLSPSTNGYADYGGRGIKVCERWMIFANFLADMGERPEGKELDRINNDGDYEPSNCRWANRFEQQTNTSRTRNITFAGKTMHISAWARELGFSKSGLARRLNSWPLEVALTRPKDSRGGAL